MDGGTVVRGKDGSFHGYRAWSFHTLDAVRQLTVSLTFGTATGPTTSDFLTRTAPLFADFQGETAARFEA